MITRNDAIQIADSFIENNLKNELWFQNINSAISAIIFYGSRSKETNREDSDIDILIILPLEYEVKFTVGEYVYDYKGFEINIVLRSVEKLREIAREKKDTFQKEVFRNSEILIDKDGEVTSILKEIDKIKF